MKLWAPVVGGYGAVRIVPLRGVIVKPYTAALQCRTWYKPLYFLSLSLQVEAVAHENGGLAGPDTWAPLDITEDLQEPRQKYEYEKRAEYELHYQHSKSIDPTHNHLKSNHESHSPRMR